MNRISKLLPLENIVVDLNATSKKRVFEQVGLLFENHQHIAKNLVFESLFAREKLGSTGLGQGIAIPHGRIKGLREPVGSFIRLQVPIPFDAPDASPVGLIFVMLVPELAHEAHLQILGELAQLFSDPQCRERLRAAKDPLQIHELFASWAPRAADHHSTAV